VFSIGGKGYLKEQLKSNEKRGRDILRNRITIPFNTGMLESQKSKMDNPVTGKEFVSSGNRQKATELGLKVKHPNSNLWLRGPGERRGEHCRGGKEGVSYAARGDGEIPERGGLWRERSQKRKNAKERKRRTDRLHVLVLFSWVEKKRRVWEMRNENNWGCVFSGGGKGIGFR